MKVSSTTILCEPEASWTAAFGCEQTGILKAVKFKTHRFPIYQTAAAIATAAVALCAWALNRR